MKLATNPAQTIVTYTFLIYYKSNSIVLLKLFLKAEITLVIVIGNFLILYTKILYLQFLTNNVINITNMSNSFNAKNQLENMYLHIHRISRFHVNDPLQLFTISFQAILFVAPILTEFLLPHFAAMYIANQSIISIYVYHSYYAYNAENQPNIYR